MGSCHDAQRSLVDREGAVPHPEPWLEVRHRSRSLWGASLIGWSTRVGLNFEFRHQQEIQNAVVAIVVKQQSDVIAR